MWHWFHCFPLDLKKRNLKTHYLSFVPFLSGADSSSHHSPSHVSSDHRERTKKEAAEGKWRKGAAEGRTEREAGSSSIEEEVLTAANDSLCSDSIPSVVDEKGIRLFEKSYISQRTCEKLISSFNLY